VTLKELIVVTGTIGQVKGISSGSGPLFLTVRLSVWFACWKCQPRGIDHSGPDPRGKDADHPCRVDRYLRMPCDPSICLSPRRGLDAD
jgi:hypothetical protein